MSKMTFVGVLVVAVLLSWEPMLTLKWACTILFVVLMVWISWKGVHTNSRNRY